MTNTLIMRNWRRGVAMYVLVKRVTMRGLHCIKCVRIRSYSGPYFSAFGPNTERYSVPLRI